MRITGGKYRGRTIGRQKGVLRPAMDRMRESLFSILGPLYDLSFCDLFAGSGIMSLEAASRGAEFVEAVEKDSIKKRVLLENFKIADESTIRVAIAPVERYIKKTNYQFDIIYLDPPFPYKFKQQLIQFLSESRMLNEDTIIIMHHPSEDKFKDEVGCLEKYDRREYGRSILTFYRVKEGNKTDETE